MRPFDAPVPLVDGNHLAVHDESDRIDAADHLEILVSMLRRNRIIVTVEADQRQRIGRVLFGASRFEIRVGKRKQGGSFFRKQFADRLRLHLARLGEFVPAFLFKRFVERPEVRKFRHRNHEVVPQIIDRVFNVPFFLRLTDPAEMVLEKIRGLQFEQPPRRLLAATADDLRDVDLRVVELDQSRNAAEKKKEVLQRILERFGAFLRISPDVTDITVRQRDGGIGDLPANPADHGLREAEIELRLATRMGERNKDRLGLTGQFRDHVTDGSVAEGIAVFVAKTFVNAFGRVLLFRRERLVLRQIILDQRNVRSQLRPTGRLPFILAGRLLGRDFRDGSEVQVEPPDGFTLGNALDEQGVTDLGPKLHIGVHRVGIVTVVRMIGLGK